MLSNSQMIIAAVAGILAAMVTFQVIQSRSSGWTTMDIRVLGRLSGECEPLGTPRYLVEHDNKARETYCGFLLTESEERALELDTAYGSPSEDIDFRGVPVRVMVFK